MNGSLSKGKVAAYAAAVGPVAIFGLPFSVYLPPYISAGGVIAVSLVGLMFSLCTLWDGVVDPAIGTMIDRVSAGDAPHRRWMRLAAGPLAALLLVLVFAGDSLPFAGLFVVLIFFYSSFSLFDVAHLSWGAALAGSPSESARLFGGREWAAKLFLILAFAAPAIAQLAIPGLSLQGRIIAYASLVVLALPIALFAISRIPARTVRAQPGIGWRRELAATMGFRPLMLLLVVQILGSFAFGSLTSLFVFFADGALRLDDRSAVLLFGTFVGGAIFTPFWTRAAIRYGKPQTMIGMSAWLVAVLIASFFVAPGNFWQAMLFATALGSGFVTLIFIHGMVADLAPHDAKRCGRERTAFLYAMINLVQKMGVASAIAVSYALLDAIGFDARNAAASADAIKLLFSGLPMIAWGIMAVLLFWLMREPELDFRRRPI
jgi:glycoside/pentoside/hexuronide:cation symporter, GPH family